MIDVIVGANGSVKAVTLGKTSGFRILDTQALIVVRRVSKLFVPLQLRGRDIAVTIPIDFICKICNSRHVLEAALFRR
jgi:TonB family protein